MTFLDFYDKIKKNRAWYVRKGKTMFAAIYWLHLESESYIGAPRKDERGLYFMRSYRMQQEHRSCIRI